MKHLAFGIWHWRASFPPPSPIRTIPPSLQFSEKEGAQNREPDAHKFQILYSNNYSSVDFKRTSYVRARTFVVESN